MPRLAVGPVSRLRWFDATARSSRSAGAFLLAGLVPVSPPDFAALINGSTGIYAWPGVLQVGFFPRLECWRGRSFRHFGRQDIEGAVTINSKQRPEDRETVQDMMNRSEPPPDEDSELEDEPQPLGLEAPEIIHDAALIGGRRLRRPFFESAVTGFIGGMSVSFGAVALAWANAAGGVDSNLGHLLGALAFPVGFIILLVGKSELFTENFFLPVTAVLEREGTPQQLARLWSSTLLFNLIGVLVFAMLISRPEVLDPGPATVLSHLAEERVGYAVSTAVIKAVFAGWIMTLLTWLLLASEGFTSKLLIIWIMGALIVLGEFNHVIISAAEIWMAILLDADVTVPQWFFRNFLPALVGNLLGGIVFVTLLHYIQAITQARSEVDR